MDKIKTTSKSFRWEQVSKDSYKDLETGLVWSKDMPKLFSFNEAQQTPTKLYQILYLDDVLDPTLKWSIPTKEDFETAEKHGIREVLNMEDKPYWASPINSNNCDYACYFDSHGGVYYNYPVNTSYVRCIGRKA